MSGDAPPLRRDAERNRQRILAAAGRLIAVHGLGVGYDEIARAADVGVGTVYRRYPSRDALFRDLFEDRIEAAVTRAQRARDADDPWIGLCRFLEGEFELQSSDRGLRQFLLGGPNGTELGISAGDRIRPVLTELVERAHAAGSLREDAGETDIPIILAMIGALMDASVHVEPELWRRYLALVLDGLHREDGREQLPGPALGVPALKGILSGWVPPARRAG